MRPGRRSVVFPGLVFIVVGLWAASAAAQAVFGAISGTITDSSGGSVTTASCSLDFIYSSEAVRLEGHAALLGRYTG